MAYFPFITDIKDKLVIIAGGGMVAFRKIEKLLLFEPKIKIIAPDVCDEIKNLTSKNPNVQITPKRITKDDLYGAFCVISATNCKKTNNEIFNWCKEFNIPINSVDDFKNCTFIFPALIKKEDFLISISTNGKCPQAAAFFKALIENALPDDIGKIIRDSAEIRNQLKKNALDGQERSKIIKQKLKDAVKKVKKADK